MLPIDPGILICTVGGSPAPVIHGIRSHRPEHVLFVCSRASVPSVKEQILPALDFLPEWNILPLPNEQDLLSCVMEIRACITAFLDARHLPADTALLGDFTGGTKVMSAALVMALMERNVQFTYTGGGQRSKDGLGVVRDGEGHYYSTEGTDVGTTPKGYPVVSGYHAMTFNRLLNKQTYYVTMKDWPDLLRNTAYIRHLLRLLQHFFAPTRSGTASVTPKRKLFLSRPLRKSKARLPPLWQHSLNRLKSTALP